MRGLLRRIQLLPQELASCANRILLGTLPMEAFLDSQVLGLFGRTLRLKNAKEKELIWRQLALKDSGSSSWTQKVRKILTCLLSPQTRKSGKLKPEDQSALTGLRKPSKKLKGNPPSNGSTKHPTILEPSTRCGKQWNPIP